MLWFTLQAPPLRQTLAANQVPVYIVHRLISWLFCVVKKLTR